ncbi:transcriptional regulator, partial [Methylobacterium hispanicum]
MTIVRTRTPSGEAIVILPEAEFERLRELAEDTLDARLVDASQERLRAGTEELLSEADLDALRAAPSPLAFWRARRGAS